MGVTDGALRKLLVHENSQLYAPPQTKQQAKTKKCDFLVNDSSTFTLVEVVVTGPRC